MLPTWDVWPEALRLAGATLLLTAFLRELRDPGRSRLAWGVLGLAGLATGGFGVLLATVAPLAARTERPLLPLALEYLEQSQHGPTLLLPIVPAVYGLLLWYGARSAASQGMRTGLYWMTGIALLAVATLLAYGGHGADEEGWEQFGMLLQAVHVTAGVAWVALVLSLVPALITGERLAHALQRFGNWALVLVLALVPSGLGATWLHGTPIPWPIDSPYGQLLTLKVLALALALAAAGWNRWIELPRRPVNETRLRRVLGLEAGLLTLTLFLAAWLARTLPIT